MHLRDASGRRVSILNEGSEDAFCNNDYQTFAISHYCSSQRPRRDSIPISLPPLQASCLRDVLPLSNTPVLLRSDSFDSQASCDLPPPLTPISSHHDYQDADRTAGCRSPFYGYTMDHRRRRSRAREDAAVMSRTGDKRRSSSSAAAGKEPAIERKGRRYSCRYAEELNCDKTFTTSGHASRHAKIHFAMRTVPCSFESCTKMFTRSDNMKQHLETHYKKVGGREPPASTSGSGSDSGHGGFSRPLSRKHALSPVDYDRMSSSEFELPMRPSRSRRLGSADSSAASRPLATLGYVARHAKGA